MNNVDLGASTVRCRTLISVLKEFCSHHAATLRLAGFFAILVFSFWVGMDPHWNYPYPLHVDEWFAIGFAQSTLDAGALEYPNPYRPGDISFHPEMGFHLILGFLKTATGLSWMGLYRFAPGIMMALLTFVTYSFGRKAGFGWGAALFVSLIPTSVRTLGPAFVVPVSAAILFIPVTLIILQGMGDGSRGKSLWVLTLLIAGTIFVHPPTEVVITALAVFYLIGFVTEAMTQKRYGEGARLLFAIAIRVSIPVLIMALWLPSLTKRALQQVVNSGVDPSATSPSDIGSGLALGLHTGFFEAFGIAAVVVFVIGFFLYIVRGDFGLRSYLLPVFTGLLLAYLVFLFPTYEIGPNVLYYRGWSYLGLFMAILGGYCVAVYFRAIPAMASSVTARMQRPVGFWTAWALWLIGLAVIIFVLLTGPVTNGEHPEYAGYYHVVDEAIFADFSWLGRHAPDESTVAMGEPSIAWAYPPIAGPGTEVWQAISAPSTNQRVEKLRQMMAAGKADVAWLRRSGISVIYTCRPELFTCEQLSNGDLFKVRQGVYLVPHASEN